MQKFKIITAVYNSEKWIGRCIESVLSQDYKDFEFIIIDDCSDDRTTEIIKSYNVDYFRNGKRNGSGLENTVKGIQIISKDSEDVILSVDGDDYLACDNVLSHLNEVYKEDIWLTYGSFLPVSRKYSRTCQPLEAARIVRKEGNYDYVTLTPATYRESGYWLTSHLKTFKRWLWDKIDDRDLRDSEGKYYKLAWDMPFMYPMIEMAGKHIKFINKILYYYNDLNPINIGTQTPDAQIKEGEEIQKKPVYAELDSHIL